MITLSLLLFEADYIHHHRINNYNNNVLCFCHFLSFNTTYTHTQILHDYIQIINPKYIISYPEVQHPHGLVTTILGLKLRINSQYFEDGAMRIKCVASISPVLWTNDKEKVLQQQLQQFHNEQIPQPSIDTREVVFLGKHLMFIWIAFYFYIFTFVFMSFFITNCVF